MRRRSYQLFTAHREHWVENHINYLLLKSSYGVEDHCSNVLYWAIKLIGDSDVYRLLSGVVVEWPPYRAKSLHILVSFYLYIQRWIYTTMNLYNDESIQWWIYTTMNLYLYNDESISIQRWIYTMMNPYLYNDESISIQWWIHIYTTMNLYNDESISIKRWIYTTMNLYLYNDESISIKRWIYTTMNLYNDISIQRWIYTTMNLYNDESIQRWIYTTMNLYNDKSNTTMNLYNDESIQRWIHIYTMMNPYLYNDESISIQRWIYTTMNLYNDESIHPYKKNLNKYKRITSDGWHTSSRWINFQSKSC